MKVRQAVEKDAFEISGFLEDLKSLGKRSLPCDQDYVRSHYIDHIDNIRCSVAEDENGEILGLQILKVASETNPYGVPVGWGIIGTHVRPSAARHGVGKTLFAASREAAKSAGLKKIDATIGDNNPDALAYYEAVGFRTYRTPDGKVCKCFEVS